MMALDREQYMMAKSRPMELNHHIQYNQYNQFNQFNQYKTTTTMTAYTNYCTSFTLLMLALRTRVWEPIKGTFP